ncbi:hypothetical protein K523DRAFT_120801 [Schizophyllum commune Tattone D]|nr:hypothetical protein K523DRAFT_120801 [Schizophyllum commune Tattone D]
MTAKTTILLFALCAPQLATAFDVRSSFSALWSALRRDDGDGYYDPNDNGGSMLTEVDNTYPEGLGEPLNMIFSGSSDADVLVDQETDGGFRNYWLSVGFGAECLGQRDASQQRANLGDGKGSVNQTSLLRWNYGDPQLGTCTETIQGGNHFRYWVQNGDSKNSGAYFFAASYEMPLEKHHDIVPNGYNIGRDEIVGNITGSAIPTLNLTDSSTYSGNTSYGGYTYSTDIRYVSGLLSNTSDGINHYSTVEENGRPAIDGLVAVLTVHILERPANDAAFNNIPLTLSAISVFAVSSFLATLL